MVSDSSTMWTGDAKQRPSWGKKALPEWKRWMPSHAQIVGLRGFYLFLRAKRRALGCEGYLEQGWTSKCLDSCPCKSHVCPVMYVPTTLSKMYRIASAIGLVASGTADLKSIWKAFCLCTFPSCLCTTRFQSDRLKSTVIDIMGPISHLMVWHITIHEDTLLLHQLSKIIINHIEILSSG